AIEAIAFIMPNMKLKSSDMPAYIVTIREIEKKTGLNFLSTLDTETESIVELVKAKNLWTE
ncbi:MAG: DNA/RNA non-specific endonuclease, partial [Nitrosomonadaceae bacterium]|nr:DNA/RNA non-specific endonuclease [Nitrosomonadaceae bacterium]MDW7664550.1 DNA/RNA non-specific endonuclease [Nitrosomonadaceae bacterium]